MAKAKAKAARAGLRVAAVAEGFDDGGGTAVAGSEATTPEKAMLLNSVLLVPTRSCQCDNELHTDPSL